MKTTSLLLAVALLGAVAGASAGTLEKARDAGKLTIGYLKDARPFAYSDGGGGKPQGYNIALCDKVADAVKAQLNLPALNVEYMALTAQDAIPAVQQGRVDLLCGAVPSLERRAQVDFSIPVILTGTGAAVRADAPTRLVQALAGTTPSDRPVWRGSSDQAAQQVKVAVIGGIPLEKIVGSRLKERRIVAEVVPVKDADAGMELLASKGADAFFFDRLLLLDAVSRSKSPGDLRVLDRLFQRDFVSLAMRRDDDDFRLLVDRTLSRMYRSGEIAPIYGKYFGPPTGLALEIYDLIALPD